MKPVYRVLVCGCLAGCSSIPGLDDPRITIEPRLTLYKLNGDTRMQSLAGGGGIMNNSAMDLDEFGLRDRDEDLMFIGAYGDGFSGFEFSYQRVEMDSSKTGTLTANYGALPQSSMVQATFEMDEFRIAYTAALFHYETDDEVLFRAGIGGALVRRDAEFSARGVDNAGNPVSQKNQIEDNFVPYVSARAGVAYRGADLRFDVAYNPDATPGGDYDGDLFDFEVRASYSFEDQDVTVLGGYRISDLQASGAEGDFRFDNEFRLEGIFLGLAFSF